MHWNKQGKHLHLSAADWKVGLYCIQLIFHNYQWLWNRRDAHFVIYEIFHKKYFCKAWISEWIVNYWLVKTCFVVAELLLSLQKVCLWKTRPLSESGKNNNLEVAMTISGIGQNWGQQHSFCYWCSGTVTTPSRCCSAACWGEHALVALQATDAVLQWPSPEVCLEMIKNKTVIVSDLDKLLMGQGASQHTRDQLSVSSSDISEVLGTTTQTTLELFSTFLSLDVFSCFTTWRQMAARTVHGLIGF